MTWLLVLFLTTIVGAQAALAQANPIGQKINQRLDESKAYFNNGDFNMGANRVSEAASMLKSSPDALPGVSPVGLAASAVEALYASAQKVKGQPAQYLKLEMAQQPLLRSLCTWDSQNPRWLYLHGLAYKAQAGGPTLNVAGDRASLQMAIRQFDAALACPGAASIAADCTQQRNACQQLLAQRQAKGKEIQERGVREMYKYTGPPVAGDDSRRQGWCSACNHYHYNGEHDR